MLIAIGSLTAMGVALGGMLGAAARFLAVEEDPLEAELQAMLPGSQCGQCGYVGCGPGGGGPGPRRGRPTLCPPGGKAVAEALAKRLGVKVDLSEHVEKVPGVRRHRRGPVHRLYPLHQGVLGGRIFGATKQMHTVIVDACHGCGKCVPVCPTDAIVMQPIPVTAAHLALAQARTPRMLGVLMELKMKLFPSPRRGPPRLPQGADQREGHRRHADARSCSTSRCSSTSVPPPVAGGRGSGCARAR